MKISNWNEADKIALASAAVSAIAVTIAVWGASEASKANDIANDQVEIAQMTALYSAISEQIRSCQFVSSQSGYEPIHKNKAFYKAVNLTTCLADYSTLSDVKSCLDVYQGHSD